jgi:hypothetical protein
MRRRATLDQKRVDEIAAGILDKGLQPRDNELCSLSWIRCAPICIRRSILEVGWLARHPLPHQRRADAGA